MGTVSVNNNERQYASAKENYTAACWNSVSNNCLCLLSHIYKDTKRLCFNILCLQVWCLSHPVLEVRTYELHFHVSVLLWYLQEKVLTKWQWIRLSCLQKEHQRYTLGKCCLRSAPLQFQEWLVVVVTQMEMMKEPGYLVKQKRGLCKNSIGWSDIYMYFAN